MIKKCPLVFIPTFNERENIELIYCEIKKLKLDIDLLFLDDNSPDGTGEVIDRLAREDSRVHTIHRAGKLGIGSAHQDGIRWAYQEGYHTLVTMDCDFTHLPEDIERFLKGLSDFDVVIGSRYMDAKSLSDWNLFRKTLTHAGHFLTKHLLRMPYDASGAFRAYRLDRIPHGLFDLVHSKSYSFFFESLHVLSMNQFKILEVSIFLPTRTYGHSKMKISDAIASLQLLWKTWLRTVFERDEYTYVESMKAAAEAKKTQDEVAWDEYWNTKKSRSKILYDMIAAFYRKFIIRPTLNKFIKDEFRPGMSLLHAGCGSGQVDIDLAKHAHVTALDISIPALNHYRKIHGGRCQLMHGSIFSIPCEDAIFDGVYNLGVMEHFTEEDNIKILNEFFRVLKPGGKIVLFWPPEYGLSVLFLKGAHFFLNRVLKKNTSLHPAEITRLRSKKHAQAILAKTRFKMDRYYFGVMDLFTYSVVVCNKEALAKQPSVYTHHISTGRHKDVYS